MTAHLLYPTVLTFRRISARHDLRPRMVAVANENPRPTAGDRRDAFPSRGISPVDLSASFHETGVDDV